MYTYIIQYTLNKLFKLEIRIYCTYTHTFDKVFIKFKIIYFYWVIYLVIPVITIFNSNFESLIY